MKKQEFIDLMIEISMKCEKLQREENELKQAYINASDAMQFKVGEKVLVHKGKQEVYGFVNGYFVDSFSSDVMLSLSECKKDGTPSKRRLYYFPWAGEKVEKIE